MATKLYNANGHIKTDLIEKALLNAKDEGKLPNVPREKIRRVAEAFEEKREELRLKVGTQVNQKEVKFLIEQLMLDKHDRIMNSEWEIIKEVLMDKDFDLD